jgi:predicted O-methyltransferase YrrM
MTISADAALQCLFDGHSLTGCDGKPVEIRGAITPEFANALTRVVRQHNPQIVIEIGMAFGASTLAILRGLGPEARLISIDPFQGSDFRRAGKLIVESTDRAHQHVLVEEPDFLALPSMLHQGELIDFAYIDGMHTFDYVALDAFYIDKLLGIGG